MTKVNDLLEREYASPVIAIIRLDAEGILCSSDRDNELLEEYEGEW